MPERRLAAIDVKSGAAMESQSGLQMLRPRIYGAYEMPDTGTRTAAIVMHPTSNFMGHYLIGPLAARGIACLGLNSRYAGNDTVREWRTFEGLEHSVFACLRGTSGYPKGEAFQAVHEGLLLRPAVASLEVFGQSSTYGPMGCCRRNAAASCQHLKGCHSFRSTGDMRRR